VKASADVGTGFVALSHIGFLVLETPEVSASSATLVWLGSERAGA
jgi:hypothetical protein